MFVKMQKGDLVTHVYNDPETIADAKKKGFRMVDSKATVAKPTDGTETEASADGFSTGDGTFTGMETDTPDEEPLADTDTTADAEPTGNRNRRRSAG